MIYSKQDFLNQLDNYIYNYYKIYKYNVTSLNNAFLTSPYFYFKNIFLENKHENIRYLENINNKVFYNFVKKYDKRYIFIFNSDGNIKNPEFCTKIDIIYIKKILKEEPYNFYALNAYITYYFNKWNLHLLKYFQQILNIEKNNPHILLKLSRYQASSLYKKYKQKKYLLLWRKNILLALNQFKYKREIPTFFYSWLWNIEHEIWNYKESIRLYDLVININKNYWIEVPEPYLWKISSLNKAWYYRKSLDLWKFLLNSSWINKYNDKRDFRLYKVLSDNYLSLWEYFLFYENLKLTIAKYLEEFSFHFNNYLELNLERNKLIFNSVIEKNNYKSFLNYNNSHIKSFEDRIIISIAYLYKEKLLWNKIIFSDTRGIEILCYNYLKLIYNQKL